MQEETTTQQNEQQQGLHVQKPSEAQPNDEGYFGRPEVYDYKDVILDKDLKYDESLLKDFNDLAAKYNLSQKGANELMTMAVRLTKQNQKYFEKALSETTQSQIQSYKDMLNNDREIGGRNLESSLKAANIAYKQFASDEVQDLFSNTGLNYHPQIVKMFMNIGKRMQSDNIYSSNLAQPYKESREDILYPNM